MKKILLIDDARITRSLLRQILIGKGYLICGEASNGKDGLEKFLKMKPDLVFCDIMMAEMNGIECLGGILKEDPNANVVICTSAGDEYHIQEARDAGAKEFITKPIKRDAVIHIAEKLIGKADLEEKISYKQRMELQAEADGITDKQLLDFFEAFHMISGMGLDAAAVNSAFLMEKGEEITIGVRALLSQKMSTAEVNLLIDNFRSLL